MNEKIEYIEWGTAYKINNIIYINKNILKYPRYYDYCLEHEQKHSDKFELKDTLLDLKEFFSLKYIGFSFFMLYFLFRYPKALVQLLPFTIYKGKLAINISIIVIYFLLAVIIKTSYFLMQNILGGVF